MISSEAKALDRTLTEALRAGSDFLLPQLNTHSSTEILDRAAYHGVASLLSERLPIDHSLKCQLRSHVVSQKFWEDHHRRHILEALVALRTAGIEPVIFKGSALAYTMYSDPASRSRADTDLIVPPQSANVAQSVFRSLGYRGATEGGKERDGFLESFTKHSSATGPHEFDLHWRINNGQFLSRLFSYDELRGDAQPAPRLGSDVWVAGPIHAMLIACFHRLVHQKIPYYMGDVATYSANRLIWLYDIHLLANSFTDAHWQDLIQVAEQKQLCQVTRDGLDIAHRCFATRVPSLVMQALDKSGEPVSTYLAAGHLRRAWMDVRSIERTIDRIRFAISELFPPSNFIRTKYQGAAMVWLPWLYTRRLIEGAAKRLVVRP